MSRLIAVMSVIAGCCLTSGAHASSDYHAGTWYFDGTNTRQLLGAIPKPADEIEMALGFMREAFIEISQEEIRMWMAKEIPLGACEWDVNATDDIVLMNCRDDTGKPIPTQDTNIRYMEWMTDETVRVHYDDGTEAVYRQR